MTTAHPAITNFTAGEFSPRLAGRVDLQKYYNGAAQMENVTIHPHGGASRRAGTLYVADAKYPDKKARLVPFVFNQNQAYVLELGHQYIRFYTDQGQIYSGATPYEISSPYTQDQVAEINYCQSADVMYLAHENVAPRKLSRSGHTNWSLSTISFSSGTSDLDVKTAWSGATQPGSVTFFEQRLVFAGSLAHPQTVWLSKSGDFENFTVGSNDDDAMIYTISSDHINPIHWITPHNVLHVGTLGSIWTCGARSALDPLTPGNVKFERDATYGCTRDQGRVIGGAVVFVGRSGKKLMEQSYDLKLDGLRVRDLTLLANHITGPGLAAYDWAQDPDHTLWAVRSDGILLSGTYYPPEEVMAWCRHTTSGSFESLTVIPATGRDEVWLLVQREIQGSTVRYVEVMQDPEIDSANEAWFVDSGLEYSGASTETLSGLSHLAGETVSILADGAAHPQVTVSGSGGISLQRSVTHAVVGLPFTSSIRTMNLEAGAREGTSQGRMKRINQAAVRFYNSLGAAVSVEGREAVKIPFRTTSDQMDKALPLFTGDKVIKLPTGWDRDARIEITSSFPLPMTVLGIYPKVNTHG